MEINERFEKFYAEHHDLTPEYVAGKRMINGSYSDLHTANAFRNFQGGWNGGYGEAVADCMAGARSDPSQESGL